MRARRRREYWGAASVVECMLTVTEDAIQPLSLFEQLDAMMVGWLERNADRGGPVHPGVDASAVLIVADDAMPDVERFCDEWSMTVARPARGTIAVIAGPELAVRGFTTIAAMYRP